MITKILDAAKTKNIWGKLINNSETYELGALTHFVHQESGLKLRWALEEELSNIYPFTYIIIGAGRRPMAVYAIRPLFPQSGTEIEILVKE